jgi:hypothetical protein
MTVGERLRLQGAAEREEVRIDLDLGRLGLTKLAIYLLGWRVEERLAHRAQIEAAFAQSARRVLRRAPQRLGKVAAILDHSYSSSGSSEKRRRPAAVAWAAHYLLRAASREYRAFWTPVLPGRAVAEGQGPAAGLGEPDELQLDARGQTDLALPLVEALEWGAELVIIISDGYENDPPQGAAEVARVFRKRLDPQRRTSIIHMNPVFDAEHYAPRTLGEAIPTVGLRDAEDLLTMLGFARFADGAAPLAELEAYLAERVKGVLAGRGPEAGDEVGPGAASETAAAPVAAPASASVAAAEGDAP